MSGFLGKINFNYKLESLKRLSLIKFCSLLIDITHPLEILVNVPRILHEECLNTITAMQWNLQLPTNRQTTKLLLKDRNAIVWLPDGSIDLISTYQKLKPDLPPQISFQIASSLFLEEDVLEIWDLNEISEDDLTLCKSKYWLKCCKNIEITYDELLEMGLEAVRYKCFYAAAHFWEQVLPDQHDQLIQAYLETGILISRHELVTIDTQMSQLFKFMFVRMSDVEKMQFLSSWVLDIVKCTWFDFTEENFTLFLKHYLTTFNYNFLHYYLLASVNFVRFYRNVLDINSLALYKNHIKFQRNDLLNIALTVSYDFTQSDPVQRRALQRYICAFFTQDLHVVTVSLKPLIIIVQSKLVEGIARCSGRISRPRLRFLEYRDFEDLMSMIKEMKQLYI